MSDLLMNKTVPKHAIWHFPIRTWCLECFERKCADNFHALNCLTVKHQTLRVEQRENIFDWCILRCAAAFLFCMKNWSWFRGAPVEIANEKATRSSQQFISTQMSIRYGWCFVTRIDSVFYINFISQQQQQQHSALKRANAMRKSSTKVLNKCYLFSVLSPVLCEKKSQLWTFTFIHLTGWLACSFDSSFILYESRIIVHTHTHTHIGWHQ